MNSLRKLFRNITFCLFIAHIKVNFMTEAERMSGKTCYSSTICEVLCNRLKAPGDERRQVVLILKWQKHFNNPQRRWCGLLRKINESQRNQRKRNENREKQWTPNLLFWKRFSEMMAPCPMLPQRGPPEEANVGFSQRILVLVTSAPRPALVWRKDKAKWTSQNKTGPTPLMSTKANTPDNILASRIQ
jgi:hypothetical protein